MVGHARVFLAMRGDDVRVRAGEERCIHACPSCVGMTGAMLLAGTLPQHERGEPDGSPRSSGILSAVRRSGVDIARQVEGQQRGAHDLVGIDPKLLIERLPATRLPELIDTQRYDRRTPNAPQERQ